MAPEVAAADVAGTTADTLVHTAREFRFWEQGCMGYWIPVIPGDYRVTLMFAPLAASERDHREFTVEVKRAEAVPPYDSRRMAAGAEELTTVDVKDSDAVLDIAFAPKRVAAWVRAIEVRRLEGAAAD